MKAMHEHMSTRWKKIRQGNYWNMLEPRIEHGSNSNIQARQPKHSRFGLTLGATCMHANARFAGNAHESAGNFAAKAMKVIWKSAGNFQQSRTWWRSSWSSSTIFPEKLKVSRNMNYALHHEDLTLCNKNQPQFHPKTW